MENERSREQRDAELRAAFRAASERIAAEINDAMMIISIRLELLRRNLHSRDEKLLNAWIDEIAQALQRVKNALAEHLRTLR